jgi:hypothetical protein
MDHKDQFSKWMSAVEEGLRNEELGNMPLNLPSMGQAGCNCGKWDCSTCFPDDGQGHEEPSGILVVGSEIPNCPSCGHALELDHGCDLDMHSPAADEVDMVLADQFSDEGSESWTDDERGEMSPLTYGDDNLTRKITYEDNWIKTDPSKRGEHAGQTVADLKKDVSKIKNGPHPLSAKKRSDLASDEFAIRAKQHNLGEAHELEDGNDSKHPLLAQFSPIQLTEFKLIVQGRGQLENHPTLAEKIARYYQESGEMPEQIGNIYEWVRDKLDEDFGGALEENIMKLNEFDMNDEFGSSEQDMEPEHNGMGAAPHTQMMVDPDEDVSELIGKIQYIQDMGLSASPHHYDPEILMKMSPEMVKRTYQKVKGGVEEHANPVAQELAQDHQEIEADNMYEGNEFGDDHESDDCKESPEIRELAQKLANGEISFEEFQAKAEELGDPADDLELDGLAFAVGEDKEVDECDMDSLSPIEKKIAIAKAALDRKNQGLEEEGDDTNGEPNDHGLGRLGNKIVDAKMKHFGKENSVFNPPSEVMDGADPEIMEWVKRFAARDSIMQENIAQHNPKKIESTTERQNLHTPQKTMESADAETLEWYARLKKVAR